MGPLVMALPAIASGIGKLFGGLFGGGHKSQPAQTQDARLQTLLPLLMPLLQQSQQASSQNYALQQRRYLMTDPGAASLMPGAQVPQGALPLQEMVAKMTANILPNSAMAGLFGGHAPTAGMPRDPASSPDPRDVAQQWLASKGGAWGQVGKQMAANSTRR